MLYFFDGHHTKPSDFKFLKAFQSLVNVIPVIAKADSFKKEELFKMKRDVVLSAFEEKVKFFDCYDAIR